MSRFLEYINVKVFFVSFVIGITTVYFWGHDIKNVVIYPTPYNNKRIQYKDTANSCFSFKSIEKSCPLDKKTIQTIPIQYPQHY